MKELSMVLDELVTCGETLISTANALREIFSEPAADTGPATKTAKSPKGKTAKAASSPPEASKPSAPSETSSYNQPDQTTSETNPDQPPVNAAPAPKSYTKEEVRGILAGISSVGHSDEVRALLLKFGAKQLKQVDPKDYAALIKEAAAIGQIKTEEDEVNADE